MTSASSAIRAKSERSFPRDAFVQWRSATAATRSVSECVVSVAAPRAWFFSPLIGTLGKDEREGALVTVKLGLVRGIGQEGVQIDRRQRILGDGGLLLGQQLGGLVQLFLERQLRRFRRVWAGPAPVRVVPHRG